MHKLERVEQIFCINLDYCPDRWRRITERFSDISTTLTRLAAVSPADRRVFDQKVAGNKLSAGAIGCSFSHLQAWKKITTAAGDDKLFMVLEDDVFFQRDWVQVVNDDLSHLKEKITSDIPFYYQLNGSGFLNFEINESPERKGLFSIFKERVYFTGGYILNRAACQALIDQFHHPPEKLIVAADHMTQWLQEKFGGPFSESQCFFHYPWIAVQECYESYIQSESHFQMVRDFNENTLLPYFSEVYEPPVVAVDTREKSMTLVTMFYDLAKRENNRGRRQKEAYFTHGDFVLGLPYPLVIFTEPENEEYLRRRRIEVCPNHPATLVVARTFERLPFFSNMVDAMKTNWKTATPVFPEKLTAEYSLMCCGRPGLVAEVAEWNPFQSTHFGWLDFGCAHIRDFQANFEASATREFFLPDNDRLFIPQKNIVVDTFDLAVAATNLLDQVLGTYFCGTRRAVITYAGMFSHALHEAVFTHKLCPADEPIATWLKTLYPSFFNCYRTEWSTLLADACCRDPEEITRKNRRRDYEDFFAADTVTRHKLVWPLLNAVIARESGGDFSAYEVYRLYVESFVTFWYHGPEGLDGVAECEKVARHQVDFLLRDFEEHGLEGKHVQQFLEKREDLCYNFGFLPNSETLLAQLKLIK